MGTDEHISEIALHQDHNHPFASSGHDFGIRWHYLVEVFVQLMGDEWNFGWKNQPKEFR